MQKLIINFSIRYFLRKKIEKGFYLSLLVHMLMSKYFLIINVSNIVPQICEIFKEKKSAFKLERIKYLTFIVIIMDINWSWYDNRLSW